MCYSPPESKTITKKRKKGEDVNMTMNTFMQTQMSVFDG